MKKLALLTLFIGALSANVHAQFHGDTLESIGFSNPDHIDIIRNYRLPDWGYSNFWMNFSVKENGFLSDDDALTVQQDGFNQSHETDKYSNVVKFGLSPRYRLYRENEQRIFNLSTNINTNYKKTFGRYESIRTPGVDNHDDTNRDTTRSQNYYASLSTQSNLRHYLLNRWFLYGSNNAHFNISHDEYNRSSYPQLIDEEYVFSNQLSLGFGWGRVRNVTPTVRAVRLHDRWRAVSGRSLSNRQIEATADQFTKLGGYRRRYDRHEKYFWQDLFRTAGINHNAMSSAFDLFYLSDVLDEALGSRREGWEALVFGRFNYSTGLYRTEEFDHAEDEKILNRRHYIDKTVSWNFRGNWFHNLSLRHQLGLTSTIGYYRYPDRSTKDLWEAQLRASWLYSISDRFLLRTSLLGWYHNQFQSWKEVITSNQDTTYTEIIYEGHRRQKESQINLDEELTYFIENKLALNVNLSLDYIYFHYESRMPTFPDIIAIDQEVWGLNWNFRAGIKYYFYRNLY